MRLKSTVPKRVQNIAKKRPAIEFGTLSPYLRKARKRHVDFIHRGKFLALFT
jgi:hypothetical protein